MPGNARSPHLSIIIPALNEARRLPPSLEKIARFISERKRSVEIIVVDNGSTDGTSDRVREFANRHRELQVTLIAEPRPGKGAAVRAGMLRGTGDVLFICDADLSMPIEELEKFITELESGTDVVIGCREGVGSRRIGEPYHRKLMGRLFNKLVQILTLTGLPDTQCGFKAFRREVAHDVFKAQTICGWGFDVEILSIVRRRGYSLRSIPIAWNYDSDSRVRPFRDAIVMLSELWAIRKRVRLGLYDHAAEPQTVIISAISAMAFSSMGQAKSRAA